MAKRKSNVNVKEVDASKVDVPEVDVPEVDIPEVEDLGGVDKSKENDNVEKEKVRIVESFVDLYIGGTYYTGIKQEFSEYPKSVAKILRETGLAI